MGKLTITVHMFVYYIELFVAVYMLTNILTGISWRMLLGIAISSSVLCNVSSAIRVQQTMDFYHKPCGLCMCIFLHVLQMGPLWRYLKLTILYSKDDGNDLIRIKLIHTCLFSVPAILYFIYFYLQHLRLPVYLVIASTCFISTIITISHFSDFENKGRGDVTVWICTLLWRAFMLFSRFSALVWALSSPFNLWVALILGVHFVILMIWYQLREQADEQNCSGLRLWLLLVSLSNTVDLTISEYKISIRWLVGFYALILSENVTMVGIWYGSLSEPSDLLHTLWLVAVFASFALGLLLALTAMSLASQETKNSSLQMTLKCCCPGTRRDDLEKAAFVWDSYDTKKKVTHRTNKAFDMEERQKHVDIINNPLGVSDAVSLSTATTAGPRSPAAEERLVNHGMRSSSPKQVTVEINTQPNVVKSPTRQRPFARRAAPSHASTTPAYFLSGAHMNTAHNQRPESSGLSLSSSTTAAGAENDSLPPLAKPRRRLLFLTPAGLMTTNDNWTYERNNSSGVLGANPRSCSERDLRPRWVDLNRLYYNSFSSSDTAIDSLPMFSEDESSLQHSTAKLAESQGRVKNWLSEASSRDRSKRDRCRARKEFETPL